MANKKVLAGAAALIILGAAYPATVFFTGKQIESIHDSFFADPEKGSLNPYVKIVKRDYQRELFGATETVVFEINNQFLDKARKKYEEYDEKAHQEKQNHENTAKTDESEESDDDEVNSVENQKNNQKDNHLDKDSKTQKPFRIILKSQIKHGPFTNGGFGAGSETSTIEFEDVEIQKVMSSLFNNKPILTSQTTYDYSGSGTSNFLIPALYADLEKSEAMKEKNKEENKEKKKSPKILPIYKMEAITGEIKFSKGFEKYTMRMIAPSFKIDQKNEGTINISNIKFDANINKVFKDAPIFSIGTQNFSIAEIDFSERKTESQNEQNSFKMNNLVYNTTTSLNGNNLDFVLKTNIEKLMIQNENYAPVNYNFSLRNLHAQKAIDLYKLMMNQSKKEEALKAEIKNPAEYHKAYEDQIEKPMRKSIFSFLSENPEFNIDKISFNFDGKEANLSSSFKLSQVTEDDLDNPMKMIPKLDITSDLALPKSLIYAMSKSSKKENQKEMEFRQQMTENMIQGFIQQEYTIAEGDVLKTKINFKDGKLLLNNKPFDLMKMMR